MQDVLPDRAQQMIFRLWEQGRRGDPEKLYHESGEVIADLDEAWTAAQEVIASLERKLDQR